MRMTARLSWMTALVLAPACGTSEPAGLTTRRGDSSYGTGGSGNSYDVGWGTGGGFSTGGGGTIDPGFGPDAGDRTFVGVYTEPLVLSDPAPPAISGGTLTLIDKGRKAAVADPDRDAVVFVDLGSMSIVATTALAKGDEPGRIVEDGAGRVHVVLRGAGAVATLDPTTGAELARVPVCSHPRGLAYGASADAIHVACMGGELVTVAADGSAPTRMLRLDRDLRDVVVDGNRLLVSRFRAAEMLVVEPTGEVSARWSALDPPPRAPGDNAAGAAALKPRVPQVAWRMIAAPGGGAIMVFQLAQVGELTRVGTGWGGPCRHLVDSAVSWVRADGLAWSMQNVRAALPVDVAISSDAAHIAVASAATTQGGPVSEPLLEPYTTFLSPSAGARLELGCGWGGGPVPPLALAFGDTVTPTGRVVALAYDPSDRLVVQTREPSMLIVGDRNVVLPGPSRKHTGHELFHLGTVGAVACASCHPEGQEDGHVWTFPGEGDRRTQPISGGILGTEPFHWSGDLADFDAIIRMTFHARMSGPALAPAHVDAFASWIDGIPRPKPPAPADPAAADRGRALFTNAEIGCAACHGGEKLTDNRTANVETGGAFQVPSLRGLYFRAPYLHNGCAATLADRFGPCGGGDAHGKTSGLTAKDVADLVAYLETL